LAPSLPCVISLGQRSLAYRIPVGPGQAKIGKHVLERNGSVVLAPPVGFGDGSAILFGEGFVVDRSKRQFAGKRIEHRPQEGFDGRQLDDGS
jgi:hypothetical protein